MTAPTHTRWSLVQAAKGDTPQARAALAELCEIYYAPIFGQMRRWLGHEDAAREMTQAFFAHVLSGDRLNGAEVSKGRFRSYFHATARNFVSARQRTEAALKRGGNAEAVATVCDEIPDGSQLTPDAEFDRAWACAVLKRSLDVLEAEMTAAGRLPVFSTLKPWLAGDATHGQTTAAAQALGISETAVRVHLSRLRKRMRGILEQSLADTLAPGADLQQEMLALKAALG
ncbi:RNA polymerase sigma factor [Prosthecobacter sp.]|uniref:RNA polymerase sigma factor n=1 Tax=Prosthecobacter sp. TaxID=1965333 RepID=UPI003784663C